jgi:CheY-like chemotaxis protein
MMPDMDGYQLARLIQQNPVLKFLPILLIIALEEALTTSASSDLKLYGIIRKPIDPDGLLEQIKAILEC